MGDEIWRYEDFVRQVIAAIEAAGVAYMIGGAVAAWAWGEPRATLDLDIVINIPVEAAGRLSKELEKRDMLVPEEIILDNILEIRADLPINAIHMHSGYKADLYPLREGDELRASAFERRQKIDLGEPLGDVYLHSPEDLIIYKLWFFSLSQQTKHVRDITSIVLSLGDELDYKYIQNWVTKKGLTSLWEALLANIRAQQ
ncbi:MAG TPA: hypothetical protein VLA49_12895 [Anaerolineales bacterium]|nr:hypothetical protein [Anaerolineales bacterium]